MSRLLSRTACIQRDGEANAAAPRALQFADAPVPAQAPPATPAMAAASAHYNSVISGRIVMPGSARKSCLYSSVN